MKITIYGWSTRPAYRMEYCLQPPREHTAPRFTRKMSAAGLEATPAKTATITGRLYQGVESATTPVIAFDEIDRDPSGRFLGLRYSPLDERLSYAIAPRISRSMTVELPRMRALVASSYEM